MNSVPRRGRASRIKKRVKTVAAKPLPHRPIALAAGGSLLLLVTLALLLLRSPTSPPPTASSLAATDLPSDPPPQQSQPVSPPTKAVPAAPPSQREPRIADKPPAISPAELTLLDMPGPLDESQPLDIPVPLDAGTRAAEITVVQDAIATAESDADTPPPAISPRPNVIPPLATPPLATPPPASTPNAPSATASIPPIQHACTTAADRHDWPLPSTASAATDQLSLHWPPVAQLETQWIEPLSAGSARSPAQRKQQAVLQWTLAGTSYPAFRCHIEARVGERLQLRLRYLAQLAADQRWEPFTTIDLARTQEQLVRQMTQQTAALTHLQQQYRLASRKQQNILRPQRDVLESSIRQLQAALQQLQQLAILHATVHDQSPLSVRLTDGGAVLFATE